MAKGFLDGVQSGRRALGASGGLILEVVAAAGRSLLIVGGC